MEEAVKALAPWPVLQGIVIGLIVAAAGFWAMRRGLESKRRETAAGEPMAVRPQLTEEERRLQWKFYEQMDHVTENSFATVKHMEKLVELQLMTIAALNRLADPRWNNNQ